MRRAPARVSGQREIRGRLTAVTAALDVEGDLLAVRQAREAGPLDGGDVDEHVARAALGLDEAEALGGVEPFHGAVGHRDVSSCCRPRKCGGPAQSAKERS